MLLLQQADDDASGRRLRVARLPGGELGSDGGRGLPHDESRTDSVRLGNLRQDHWIMSPSCGLFENMTAWVLYPTPDPN